MIVGHPAARPVLCSIGRRPDMCFLELLAMKGRPAMHRGRSIVGAVLAVVLSVVIFPSSAVAQGKSKIDDALEARAKRGGWSRVIVTLKPGGEASAEIRKLGGRFGRQLPLINGQVVELPNGQIKKLAAHPAVARLDFDRPTRGQMARVANMTGARYAKSAYGLDGAGIGVAVIDSGVANWHNDLTYNGSNPFVSVLRGLRQRRHYRL
jgi:hypothetical protein